MAPRKLYLETTTRCNLQCGMCVKQAPGNSITDQDFNLDLFERIAPALPSLDSLVLNGIGEPLLHPDLLKFIERAASLMPSPAWIGFQSNGLLLTQDKLHQLFDAGLSRLCISVDSAGVSSSTPGQDLLHPSQLQQPLALASQTKSQHGFDRVQIGAEIVLLRNTIELLPSLVTHLASQGVEFILASHMLAYQEGIENQSLFFPGTPEALHLFHKWRQHAENEGLCLTDFKVSTWIAPRCDEDHRLLAIYRQMLAEAKEQDVWLDVDQLAAFDADRQKEIELIFGEAEENARKHGVELSLPPLLASQKRSCRFMEDEAIFIDVSGEVMPCHPLWHQQTIFGDGKATQFHKHSFGSLSNTDLLSIWDSEPYQTFRAAARRYDSPFCHSCSVGPCPDIDGMIEPFIDDCFATGVPCGHCLWCFDAVRCL